MFSGVFNPNAASAASAAASLAQNPYYYSPQAVISFSLVNTKEFSAKVFNSFFYFFFSDF